MSAEIKLANEMTPQRWYADCVPCNYLGPMTVIKAEADYHCRKHNHENHGAVRP